MKESEAVSLITFWWLSMTNLPVICSCILKFDIMNIDSIETLSSTIRNKNLKTYMKKFVKYVIPICSSMFHLVPQLHDLMSIHTDDIKVGMLMSMYLWVCTARIKKQDITGELETAMSFVESVEHLLRVCTQQEFRDMQHTGTLHTTFIVFPQRYLKASKIYDTLRYRNREEKIALAKRKIEEMYNNTTTASKRFKLSPMALDMIKASSSVMVSTNPQHVDVR